MFGGCCFVGVDVCNDVDVVVEFEGFLLGYCWSFVGVF